MILADKISELRKKNDWSQEELAGQLGVSRQSVSKWESAASIPDLDKILKMSELFGVSTDYLLKDSKEPEEELLPAAAPSGDYVPEADSAVRCVSLEEANDFLDTVQDTAPRIAAGVSMCILSPVLLIFLFSFVMNFIIFCFVIFFMLFFFSMFFFNFIHFFFFLVSSAINGNRKRSRW